MGLKLLLVIGAALDLSDVEGERRKPLDVRRDERMTEVAAVLNGASSNSSWADPVADESACTSGGRIAA